MDDKYTVTFKVAEIRANYYKELKTKETDTSSAGHLWFVLQKNGSESQSWGFQRIEDTFFDGYVSDKDDSRYYEVADSITIQLSKKQIGF